MRTLGILAVCGTLWGVALPATAQLQLRLPISFPTFAPGSSFQTTPLPLANSDYCTVTGSQPEQGQFVQCGEVDTVTDFGFQVGGTYSASVQATSFVSGSQTVNWSPTLACVRVGSDGESIAGGSSSFCLQSITRAGQGVFWDLGGILSISSTATGGSYTANVTLTVRGPRLNSSITVPATLNVKVVETTCTLRNHRSVSFGSATARKSGTVTLSSVHGTRSYSSGQSDPSGSSQYTFGKASVTTNSGSVVVTVQAPSTLQGAGSTLPYTLYSATRTTPTGSYRNSITGSGTATLAVTSGQAIEVRFGGRVSVSRDASAGTYSGTAQVSFQCN